MLKLSQIQLKLVFLQAFWDSLPRSQRGRRKKPWEADRVQKALQIQEVWGDWGQITNLVPIWTLHHLLLGSVEWNNRVDRGACLPLDFPGGRIRRNPQPFSWLLFYDCLGWPQEVAIPFMVQIWIIGLIQLLCIVCILHKQMSYIQRSLFFPKIEFLIKAHVRGWSFLRGLM